MQSGFDVVERTNYTVKGITGEVSKYAQESKYSYPYFMIFAPVQKFKLELLRSMFGASEMITKMESSMNGGDASDATSSQIDNVSPVTIYYRDNERTLRLGKIQPKQVKTFLSLFKDDELRGALSAERNNLPRSYLYAFCEAMP